MTPSWLLLAAASAVVAVLLGRRMWRMRARRRVVIGAHTIPSRPRRLRRAAVVAMVAGRPQWQVAAVAVVTATVVAAFLGGPVAAFMAFSYGALAARAVRRRRLTREQRRARTELLDRLSGFAADLRAGLPVPSTLTRGAAADGEPLIRLTRAAVGLASETGAPLAELVERIESDARATDRTLASADAQAAGARATALLLAGLPFGGVALGFGLGVDPLHVLLHTPLGAGCAVGAVVLQLLGLAWTNRLAVSAR
jgi:tight adherence protein B